MFCKWIVHMNITLLSQAINTVGALIFNCWVPPAGKMHYMVGSSECEAYTCSFWRKNYNVKVIMISLE